MYLGARKIGDTLTFYRQTSNRSTGVAVDADSVPTYRIYEHETGTAILTGSMALLDSSNTDGWYSEQITVSSANGFELDKSYGVRIADTVATVAGAVGYCFNVVAGEPIEQAIIPASRILQVRSRNDGTFGVVGRIRMVAGERSRWALEFKGTQLPSGGVLYGMSTPSVSGAEAANLTVQDHGIDGTQAKVEVSLSASATTSDTIQLDITVQPSSSETIIVPVTVTVGS